MNSQRTIVTKMRLFVALLVVSVVLGSGLAGCASLKTSEARTAGPLLQDAGFVMNPADTPEALAALRTLPPRKLVPVERNGRRHYVYADPDVCKCVYEGTEQAYRTYAGERLRVAQQQMFATGYRGFYGPWPWY